MPTTLETVETSALGRCIAELATWQRDELPLQLHPGDVGWLQREGPSVTAAGLRGWWRDERLVALGMLDGPDVVRVAFAPHVLGDAALATQVAADVSDPACRILPSGPASVESPSGSTLDAALAARGWARGEAWQPSRRALADPVVQTALRIEAVDAAMADERAAVQRSAFGGSRFDASAWSAMAAGPAFADARDLVGRDASGVAVAMATVWAAGDGRPGLLEPLGVHADHRGRGFGVAMAVAAAAALRDMGASSALVCTPSANVAAVATYRAAGFVDLPERFDRARTESGQRAIAPYASSTSPARCSASSTGSSMRSS